MKFLTIDDVCEMLSISRRTLERMRAGNSSSLKEMLEPRSNDRSLSVRDSVELIDELGNGGQRERIPFPEPDMYLGKSPRWEMDKLLSWLEKNGHRL